MSHSDTRTTDLHRRPGAQLSAIAGAMLGGLAGCAVDAEPAEPQIIERAPEILGAFETRGGATITFKAQRERGPDGAPVLSINELAPGDAPSYLAQLRALGATSLEAFLALAPAGTEAPAALRDAHAGEAAALGRSAELRSVPLIAAATTPSANAICNSYAAFTTGVSGLNSEVTDDDTGGQSLSFLSGGNVQAFMCTARDLSASTSKSARFCAEIVSGFLNCGSWISVPDGYLTSELWINATSGRAVQTSNGGGPAVMSYAAIGALPPEG